MVRGDKPTEILGHQKIGEGGGELTSLGGVSPDSGAILSFFFFFFFFFLHLNGSGTVHFGGRGRVGVTTCPYGAEVFHVSGENSTEILGEYIRGG